MAKRVGIVAASFALRSEEQEPNPCNIRLAKSVERIVAMEPQKPIVVSQWEITRQLKKDRWPEVEADVGLKEDGTYLGAEDVWAAASDTFRAYGVTDVIIVAQLLVRLKLEGLAKADGFNVVRRHVGWIGFDRSDKNTQPWTRGPLRLLWYAVSQVIFHTRGHEGRQNA